MFWKRHARAVSVREFCLTLPRLAPRSAWGRTPKGDPHDTPAERKQSCPEADDVPHSCHQGDDSSGGAMEDLERAGQGRHRHWRGSEPRCGGRLREPSDHHAATRAVGQCECQRICSDRECARAVKGGNDREHFLVALRDPHTCARAEFGASDDRSCDGGRDEGSNNREDDDGSQDHDCSEDHERSRAGCGHRGCVLLHLGCHRGHEHRQAHGLQDVGYRQPAAVACGIGRVASVSADVDGTMST